MQQAGALAFPCVRCGQPRSIPVRDFWIPPCAACGDASPPPVDIQDAIRAARVADGYLPVAVPKEAAGSDIYERSTALYRWSIPAVLMAIPMVISWRSIIWAYADDARIEEFVYELLLQLPLPAYVVLGVIIWRSERAAREAARVPTEHAVDHVAMTCRFCGGPLDSRSLEQPVVACPHCNRQNIMDAGAIAARLRDEVNARQRRSSARRPPWRNLTFIPPLFTVLVLLLMFFRLWNGRF